MTDVLTPDQRRLNMKRIKGKDTKPEMLLRRSLHAAGFRFRLHVKQLPGCPDLVFPRYHAVVQIHGCFWHGHNCPLFRLPATRTEFWETKISGNQDRDRLAANALQTAGWRILTVWECSLRGPSRLPIDEVLKRCTSFIKGNSATENIVGAHGHTDNSSSESATKTQLSQPLTKPGQDIKPI